VPDGDTGAITMTFDITYKGFSYDGKNTFDGTETFSLKMASATSTTASIDMTLKANVKMSGDYDVQLTCDVTISMTQSATGDVSMTINGNVSADGSSYDFNHETVSVAASK